MSETGYAVFCGLDVGKSAHHAADMVLTQRRQGADVVRLGEVR